MIARNLARTALALSLLLGLGLPAFAANGTLLVDPKRTFVDNNGDPCDSCLLFFYTAGTSTKQTVYSDVGLLSSLTNPVVLDSSGRISAGGPFAALGTSFKLVLAPSTDSDPPVAPIWSQDNVQPPTVGAAIYNTDITGVAGETLTAGNVVYLSTGAGGTTAGRWYRTDSDVVATSTGAQATGFVVDDISTGSSGSIRRAGQVTGLSGLTPGSIYYVSATAGAITATPPTNARIVGQAETSTVLTIVPIEAAGTTTTPGNISTTTQEIPGLKEFVLAPVFRPGTVATYDATVSGRTLTNTTAVGNVGAGTDDLISTTVKGNTLSADGKVLRFTCTGTLGATANNKSIIISFGAFTFTIVPAVATNGGFWHMSGVIIRTGAATQIISAAINIINGAGGTGTAFAAGGAPTETLSGDIVFKLQGIGTSNDDVRQTSFIHEVVG